MTSHIDDSLNPAFMSSIVNPDNSLISHYGVEKAYQEVRKILDVHNDVIREYFAEHCDIVQEPEVFYGEKETGDGYIIPVVQIPTQIALNWTTEWYSENGLSMLQVQAIAALQADVMGIRRSMIKALLNNTSPYPLLNADETYLPAKYQSKNHPGKQQHYSASFGLTKSIIHGLYDNVAEHSDEVKMCLYTPQRQKELVERVGKLGREIEIKPLSWLPVNYFWMVNTAEDTKPFAFYLTDMEMVGEGFEVRTMERQYGLNIQNRHSSAIHFLDTPKYELPTRF